MTDQATGEETLDIEAIERQNESRKEGSGHSPTCVGWTADPTGAFSRESCTCSVGFVESDIDALLAEVRRLRGGGSSS